jgi:hypothetical protein
MKHVGVASEDLANSLRVGKHYEWAAAGDVERERIAVAAMARVEQPEGVARELDELPPTR